MQKNIPSQKSVFQERSIFLKRTTQRKSYCVYFHINSPRPFCKNNLMLALTQWFSHPLSYFHEGTFVYQPHANFCVQCMTAGKRFPTLACSTNRDAAISTIVTLGENWMPKHLFFPNYFLVTAHQREVACLRGRLRVT